MLSEAGSIASIVGLPLTFAALLFAIYHLVNLRGEARAARDAAEEAQRLLRRDLTIGDLNRLRGRIRHLVDLNRRGDKVLSLNLCQDIQELLLDVQRRHPNLEVEQREGIHGALELLVSMQAELENLDGDMPVDLISNINIGLNDIQINLLVVLESRLP